MPLLNPPDILPEAMRFLVRAVIATHGNVGQQELISLVAPAGLSEAMASVDEETVRSADDEDAELGDAATAGRRIAEASLTALRQLEMVQVDENRSELSTDLSQRFKTVESVTGYEFARELARQIVGDRGRTVGGDLLKACGVLFAATAPLTPFDTFAERGNRKFQPHQQEILQTDQQVDWAVGNKERWLSLLRIAPYLGWLEIVALGTNRGLVPDCSDALEVLLSDAEPRGYTAGEFVSLCASALPFLDGGEFSFAANRGEGEISGGLSLTLWHLAHRGVIQLIDESDAPALDLVVSFEPGASTRFRRVILNAPAKSRKGKKK